MSLKGKIVEYIDQGKFFCGFIMEDCDKRVHLVNQHGREGNLPHGRILHTSKVILPGSPSSQEISLCLAERMERRAALAASIVMEEIWQLVVEEEAREFDAAFLAELYFGSAVNDDHEAAFVRAVINNHLYFKFKAGMIQAHSAETVEQLNLKIEREKAQESLIAKGSMGIAAILAGAELEEWPERERCLELVRDYYLFGSEFPENDLARELVKAAGLTRPHAIHELLVQAGVWDRDENVPLLRYRLPVLFDDAVLARARALSEASIEDLLHDDRPDGGSVAGAREGAGATDRPDGGSVARAREGAGTAGRVDYRHLDVLTIDGALTQDHDDALHLEKRDGNYLVGIHIADVGHYVRPGDILFQEAKTRITSLYFPDLTVPMLPRVVSEDLCSLKLGKVRPALSFMILLTPQAEVVDCRIVRSIIETKRQLTYSAADEMIHEDEDLRILADLSRKLMRLRVEKGALILPIPDVNIAVDPDSRQIEIALSDVDTPARTLIAEFMILANFLGAKIIAEKAAPGLFRSQDPPVKRLADYPHKEIFLNFRQRKFLAPGQLTTVPRPHSGVGTVVYSTLTSPIRRFLDLVMQLQLASLIAGKGPLFSEDECKVFGGAIGEKQSRINLVKQQRHRYWILKHLERQTGRFLEAIILGKGPRKIQILLTDYLIEYEMPPNQGIREKPGDRIRVRLVRAVALDNQMRLEW